MRKTFRLFLFTSILPIVGCSDSAIVYSSNPNLTPQQSSSKNVGYYKVEAPYSIEGTFYTPKEDYSYQETGVASWYDADFHNSITANGEYYSSHAATAAHKTLPLPSMVRVTNLQNGRTLNLRVNDRGPFSNDKIISVSKYAAQLLGFEEQGTTQVKVEILANESKQLKEELLSETSNKNDLFDLEKKVLNSPQNIHVKNIDEKITSDNSDDSMNVPLVNSTETKKEVNKYNDWDKDEQPKVKQSIIQKQKTTEKKIVVSKKTQGGNSVTASANKQKLELKPGYYVQVGAFGNEDKAENVRRKVSKYGSTIIIPITVNNKKLYRVRLGPTNAKEALNIIDNVKKETEFSDARLVEEKSSK